MTDNSKSKALTTKEIEQVKVLSALGKSYRQIGREIGRSDKTIKKALTSSPEVKQEVEEIKEALAVQFQDIAKRMLTSITDEDIKKLDGYRRTLSAGISVDKAASLRGQADINAPVIIIRNCVTGPSGQDHAQEIIVRPSKPSLTDEGGLIE